ncbi:unnamed protein product [Musa hybrid cultivar]
MGRRKGILMQRNKAGDLCVELKISLKPAKIALSEGWSVRRRVRWDPKSCLIESFLLSCYRPNRRSTPPLRSFRPAFAGGSLSLSLSLSHARAHTHRHTALHPPLIPPQVLLPPRRIQRATPPVCMTSSQKYMALMHWKDPSSNIRETSPSYTPENALNCTLSLISESSSKIWSLMSVI